MLSINSFMEFMDAGSDLKILIHNMLEDILGKAHWLYAIEDEMERRRLENIIIRKRIEFDDLIDQIDNYIAEAGVSFK